VTNRLASSTSPYLLQHAENPVDWREWGEDAFDEARRRDVPVLLSIGYAACHWCHVMAHESFENPAIAAVMNAGFVCVKVDREERPDVDAVYMRATQAMTGRGGWPMTVFAAPDGRPFFCGTYFPPTPHPGVPSFRQILDAVAEAWSDRRDDLLAGADQVLERIETTALDFGETIGDEQLDRAVAELVSHYDRANGGFGAAPKFPPSMVLEFLLRHAARTGARAATAMAEGTLAAMARGGMYDQLGGGFARYSVDEKWVVPHFEKMLYDNALLLRVYAHWQRQSGSALAERVVRETAEFLLRDLATSEGGFASSLDADTDGVEGATYVWTPDELVEVLGAGDGAWARELLSVTGTFEHGTSTLQLRTDADDPDRWARLRETLKSARDRRPQPARDDKVIAAWNGLAIGALADAGAIVGEPAWVEAAARAADAVLRVHLVDGRLRRSSRDGQVGAAGGVLEDYADLADGLLALHQATGDGCWLDAAGELLEDALSRFDAGPGAFYDTADDAEQLIVRPADPTDGATPSGASALAGALLTYSALTASTRHRDVVEQILNRAGPLIERYPQAAGHAAAVTEALLAGPLEIAVVGAAGERAALERVARRTGSPGAVVVAGVSDQPGVPLLAQRPLVDGGPAAYVCRGFVCDAPITDADELARRL
jgi:uncharacterized protein YyaL (SSP411 family)